MIKIHKVLLYFLGCKYLNNISSFFSPLKCINILVNLFCEKNYVSFLFFLRPRNSVVILHNSNDKKNSMFDFGHGRHREQVATLLREKEVFVHSQPPIWHMIYLMWSAPVTKFWTFQVITFLLFT